VEEGQAAAAFEGTFVVRENLSQKGAS